MLAKGRNGSGSTLSLLAVKVTVGTLIIQMEPTSKEIYKKLILSLIISVLGYVFLNKYIDINGLDRILTFESKKT